MDGEERRELADALLQEFPERRDLDRLTDRILNRPLSHLAAEGPLTGMTHDLVVWADSQGLADGFVAQALAEDQRSFALLAFARRRMPHLGQSLLRPRLVSGRVPLPTRPSLARLLAPAHEVVDFHPGREALLAELNRWALPGVPVDVRVVWGPTGSGKTRLGQHWVAGRLAAGQWAGFLADDVGGEALRAVLLASQVEVVIDDADLQPGLMPLLTGLVGMAPKAGHLRILLLARGVGGWWRLLQEHQEVGPFLRQAPAPWALEDLPAEGRASAQRVAVERFAAQLGLAVPPLEVGGDRPGQPRALHLAALARLRPEVAVDPAGLHDDALDDPATRGTALAGLAAITLRGGARNQAQLQEILALVGTPPALADLRGPGHLVAPFETPTRLGLVAHALASAPDWVLRALRGAGPSALRFAFRLLVELEVYAPDAALAAQEALLQDDLARHALPALQAVLASPEVPRPHLASGLTRALTRAGTAELVRHLAPFLPREVGALAELAAWVEHNRPRIGLASPKEMLDYARRLATLGKVEEAKQVLQQSTEIIRKNGDDPQLLATSLQVLGELLRRQGEQEDALAASAETVEILRKLAEHDPEGAADMTEALKGIGAVVSLFRHGGEAMWAEREAQMVDGQVVGPDPYDESRKFVDDMVARGRSRMFEPSQVPAGEQVWVNPAIGDFQKKLNDRINQLRAEREKPENAEGIPLAGGRLVVGDAVFEMQGALNRVFKLLGEVGQRSAAPQAAPPPQPNLPAAPPSPAAPALADLGGTLSQVLGLMAGARGAAPDVSPPAPALPAVAPVAPTTADGDPIALATATCQQQGWPTHQDGGTLRLEAPTTAGRTHVVHVALARDEVGRPHLRIQSAICDLSSAANPLYLLTKNAELFRGALAVQGQQLVLLECWWPTQGADDLAVTLRHVALTADAIELETHGAGQDAG